MFQHSMCLTDALHFLGADVYPTRFRVPFAALRPISEAAYSLIYGMYVSHYQRIRNHGSCAAEKVILRDSYSWQRWQS